MRSTLFMLTSSSVVWRTIQFWRAGRGGEEEEAAVRRAGEQARREEARPEEVWK